MKKIKLYIQVIKPGKSFSAICANKIKELVPYLPDEEILQTHLVIEKLQLQKDEKCKPKPLYLYIERSIFNEIINKIQAKDKDASADNIPLMFQVPSIPVCILLPADAEEIREKSNE